MPAAHFPEPVQQAMRLTGSMFTCLPVQLDEGNWESALFFQLGADTAGEDKRRLAAAPVPFALDTEVIKHDNAAVATIRIEVYTDENDPLAGEVLLLPGANKTHFETLELLTRQQRLVCMFGDDQFRVIRFQEAPLGADEHREFQAMIDDSVAHDAMVRLIGRYDAEAAFNAVVANYALRDDQGESS